MMMQFDLPKDQNSIIKVIGVGGGGSNAVNHMYRQGINGVDFLICNTDQQALDASPVPTKVQLGTALTSGRGAGSIAEVGHNAALENYEEIRELLSNGTRMVFITAGMGGGTGTGAAPVIAQIAKEMGILTVGIVTYPFQFEGKKRSKQAEEGITQLRQNVDTLLVVCNDKLREMYGNLSLKEAFAKADDILTTAAKGIAEVITVTGYINVDFEDVRTVMSNSGVAIMGSAKASGENRALRAVQEAMASPLLNDNNIKGANYILLNITSGINEVMMDEIAEITDYIQDEAGSTAEIIWGTGMDETLGDNISVTLIATGFKSSMQVGSELEAKPAKIVHELKKDEPVQKVVTPLFETTAPVVAAVEPVVEKVELPVAPVFAQVETPQVEEEFTFEFEVPREQEEVAQEQVTMSFDIEEPFAEQDQVISFEEENTLPEGWEVKTIASEEVKEVVFETPSEPIVAKRLFDEPVLESPVIETPKEPSVISQLKREEFSLNDDLDTEEQMRQSQERIMRLKALSYRMKTPSGISELENEPAYKRKSVNLEKVPHSSESPVSRYTLSHDEQEGPEIRPNNSFLHDNVD
ncbi:MAG: cell division protein FtsZ [Flavobacteriales bacterium]